MHWYSFYPVWALIRRSILPMCGNTFSQWVYWYGFTPIWLLIWMSRLSLCENTFSHWVHWQGFSSLWVLIWLWISPLTERAFPQMMHLYNFSPVWFHMTVKIKFLLKCFLILDVLIWLLPNMSSCMLMVNPFVWKSFSTLGTII